MDPIGEAFRPLLGLPAWQVKRSHGSFVTFEFGQPRMDQIRYRTREGYLPDVLAGIELKLMTVRGDWHLWIYCCHWSLSLQGIELSHCESDDVTMARALRLLDLPAHP